MRVYILCAIILALFFAAGSMSYDDELKAAQHYQDMVCAKIYPDYKGINPDCEITPNPRPERY